VDPTGSANGYWYHNYDRDRVAIRIPGDSTMYLSPYDPEGTFIFSSSSSNQTYYTELDCLGSPVLQNDRLHDLAISDSGFLLKRTQTWRESVGGLSVPVQSYYGQYDGTFQCINSFLGTIPGDWFLGEQTDLLMSTYKQVHTLQWSN
jgi:hypothetical protein